MRSNHFRPQLAVTAVGLLLALTVQASELVDKTPETVAGATTVDAAAAKRLFDDEAAFVDLRKENVWNGGRIPGAIWLDFKNGFSQETLAGAVDPDEKLVFYCSGIRCPRSAKAATKAVAWGYQHVYYFRDGYPAWKNAGYPVE
jgi:rhodanese-related sulfurtransferase